MINNQQKIRKDTIFVVIHEFSYYFQQKIIYSMTDDLIDDRENGSVE
jgi:hypothetical protein